MNHHQRLHTVNFKLGFRKAVFAPHCCYGSVVAEERCSGAGHRRHEYSWCLWCRSVVDGSWAAALDIQSSSARRHSERRRLLVRDHPAWNTQSPRAVRWARPLDQGFATRLAITDTTWLTAHIHDQFRPLKAKFHYAVLVADRSEAGRRPAASWNLTYH